MRASAGSICLECFHFDLEKLSDGGTRPACLYAQERTVKIMGSFSDEPVIECSGFMDAKPISPQPARAGKEQTCRAGRKATTRRRK